MLGKKLKTIVNGLILRSFLHKNILNGLLVELLKLKEEELTYKKCDVSPTDYLLDQLNNTKMVLKLFVLLSKT